jgi:hypothetical protein
MADLTTLTGVLKTMYTPIQKRMFSLMSVLPAQARRGGADTVQYAGNDAIFSAQFESRGGFTSSTTGKLPEPQDGVDKQGRLGIARSYFVSKVDGLALKATTNSKGAYISAAKKVIRDVMQQWKIEQNRVMHGDSQGIRCVVVTRTSATEIIVDAPYGISGAGPGNLFLRVGDTVAVHDTNAANALLSKAVIGSITRGSGDQATLIASSGDFEGAGTVATGDILVSACTAATSATDTSLGAEPHGAKSIIDVEDAFATFEQLKDDRWVAQKLTSTTVDETIVMKLLNTIRARTGIDWRSNAKKMILLTTTGIWQAYGASLLGLRRFTAPTMELNGGFKGVQVAGATLIDDPYCPRGRLYAFHGPSLIFIDLMDFGMLSYEDANRWRPAAREDSYEGVHGIYWNFGATQRNAHGVISGITDTDNFSPVA